MQKKKHRFNYTTRYIILLGGILLAANILLGVVLMRQAISTIQSMVRNSMLSVSNTAAALLDGDALGALAKTDTGSPAYDLIYNQLSAFQNNVNIEYIYAVRQTGEDSFIFTVDPDPEDPAEFGEEVLVTDALRKAAAGEAYVDNAPAEDEWGNYFSAYSPVYDSRGRISGIVGVDFDAEWYSKQMRENSLSIIIVFVVALAAACGIVLFVTNRIGKQYRQLNDALTVFSEDIEELEKEVAEDFVILGGDVKSLEDAEPVSPGRGADAEIEEMRQKMNNMHKEIRQYLNYVEKKAFNDALTHVGNTTAFIELLNALDKEIKNGTADFQIAVFDLNNLKPVNDKYGHACGDRIIKAAADIISEAFGKERTFRVGGDEFVAVIREGSSAEIEAGFRRIEEAAAEFNAADAELAGLLSIAKGFAEYTPGEDTSCKDVFNRADKEMYNDKEAFHQMSGDRAFVDNHEDEKN